MNRFVQSCESQSGSCVINSLISGEGMVDGLVLACGYKERKSGRRLRDRASAKVFCLPGICLAITLKWKRAEKKNRQRIKCMMSGSLLYPLLRTSTTAMLSQCASIVFLDHSPPHIAAARTIGINSFLVMFAFSIPAGHWYWNHRVPIKAPQPHWPEASDRRVGLG